MDSRKCSDCRFSQVLPNGERLDRGWSAPCVSCNTSTHSHFEAQPAHDGAWAVVFRTTGEPVNNTWCDRLGLPKPAVYPTIAEAEAGAATMAARVYIGMVDVVPYVESPDADHG